MKNLQLKEIEIPLDGRKFIIIVAEDPSIVKQIVPEFNRGYVFADCYLADHDGKMGFFMILNDKNKTKLSHGLIAHEAAHIADWIAENSGFLINTNNNEPFAYLIEWVVNEVYKYLKELGITINTKK